MGINAMITKISYLLIIFFTSRHKYATIIHLYALGTDEWPSICATTNRRDRHKSDHASQ